MWYVLTYIVIVINVSGSPPDAPNYGGTDGKDEDDEDDEDEEYEQFNNISTIINSTMTMKNMNRMWCNGNTINIQPTLKQ